MYIHQSKALEIKENLNQFSSHIDKFQSHGNRHLVVLNDEEMRGLIRNINTFQNIINELLTRGSVQKQMPSGS